jgi:hypothetical protein
MPKVSSRRPNANPVYQTIPIGDLTGGLDLRRTPTLLAPDRSQVCRNFSLAEPGALRVRAGYEAFTTSALSTTARPFQGGQRVYLGSTQGTLLAYHGGVYRLPDASTWPSTSQLTGLSTGNQVFFPYDRDIVAALDGATTPKKSTDLVTWTRLGIDKSSVVSTLALSALANAAISTSEFGIVYTYKSRGLAFESDPIATESTIRLTSTGFQIVFNAKNSTDAQVDALVVYAKNKTAGETVYRKATSGAMSAGVSSTLLITSTAWSANEEAPSTHGTPPLLSFGVVWKNRWWARHATLPTRLYFTEIFQPQGWPALYYIDLPFENGEELVALRPLGDTLLALGQSQVFLIIGQTSLDFEVKPSLGSQGGALGPRATALIEAGVAHASAEGVFIFDGATDRLLSHDLTPGWKDMIDNSPSTATANVSMVYDWRQKELRIAVPRLYPRAARGEWVLDLNRTREGNDPAWADTDRNILHYIFWDGDEPVQGNRGQLQSYSSTGSVVTTESVGTTADGADMTAEYSGPALSAGMHVGRYTDLHVEYEPHAGSLSAETLVDGVSQGQIALGIGSGLSVYGSAVYGTGVYGGSGRRKAYTPLPLGSQGRTVQQSFVYEGSESFALYTYAVGIVPEPNIRQISE